MNQPPGQPGRRGRGHASVPHTADLRIVAWGPTREDCIAEAVRGVVGSFADVSGAGCQHAIERHLSAGSGAVPKGASLSGLTCAPDAPGRWSCAVTIDV